MAGVKSMNKAIIVGPIQPKAPEITTAGKKLAKFTVVTKDGYFDKQQQWQETSEWHDVVAWGFLADKIEKYGNKGTMLVVEGQIKTNKWQDKNTGENRQRKVIQAASITVLDKANPGSQNDSGPRTTSDIDPNVPNEDDLPYDDPF